MTRETRLQEPGGLSKRGIHRRSIDIRGYERSDGLYEVQAHLTDTKTRDFMPPGDNRTIVAGSPIHDVEITLVFDSDLVITEVEASLNAFPYRSCQGGSDTLPALVGLRIGAGWNSEIRKRLPACDTCTHMREILAPLASTAYQTLTELRRHLADERDAEGRPVKIDSCHAYGASRELVKRLWPGHSKAPGRDGKT